VNKSLLLRQRYHVIILISVFYVILIFLIVCEIAIFLSQFRTISYADLIKAAMNLDDKVLTPQQVNTFFALFPQNEAVRIFLCVCVFSVFNYVQF
jgi:hypothetical protein